MRLLRLLWGSADGAAASWRLCREAGSGGCPGSFAAVVAAELHRLEAAEGWQDPAPWQLLPGLLICTHLSKMGDFRLSAAFSFTYHHVLRKWWHVPRKISFHMGFSPPHVLDALVEQVSPQKQLHFGDGEMILVQGLVFPLQCFGNPRDKRQSVRVKRECMKACLLRGLSASYTLCKGMFTLSFAVSLTLTLSTDRLCFKDLKRAVGWSGIFNPFWAPRTLSQVA